ncbi:Conjugative transposon protein TraO [Tenacibaculum sp. MAR_2009_124]|uniref:conjugal transfer protein TraO n=1 Tax=Tenacibaculum sp. MAR_2009_124 TaxID=1250059 RepID=UPI00089B565F|nr:conjugal transfer protein TraO [Tenacibaculum sp. MAR_2009_124]SEC65642.1 Conjugative transposon protein TraO [Tenacibaculum sp. MAR_2009_124]
MKQIFFILTLLISLLSFNKVFSQIDDTSMVGLTVGAAENGFGFSLNYNYYFERNEYLSGDILLTFSSDRVSEFNIRVPYNAIYLNAGYFNQFYETNRELFRFSAGAGLSFGYQVINNGSKEIETGALITSDSKFIYGAFIGIDTKLFISYKYTGMLVLREFYHINSDIGKFTPYIGLGVTYSLF